jgi:hypothetical protein
VNTKINSYQTRTYREGDETELAKLFNRVYKKYAGFVPRTPEYWRWSCINRPDVEAEGIVIVNNGEETIGYAVVAKSGNIWEFCYDPEYEGKAVISTILEWSTEYVTDAGGDSVVFNAPTDDQLLREVCLEFGFAEKPPPCLFLNVLDFPQFIHEILSLKQEKLKEYDEELLIKIKKSHGFYDKEISIKIEKGAITVNRKTNNNSCVIIESDVSTIVSCILGTQGLLQAFLGSKIKVKPFWKTIKILKIFSLLKIKDPWFSPGTDYG